MLWIEDGEQIDKSHPGCMSSIFHVLDYEHWNSKVKKILPHRKRDVIINHSRRNRRHKRISHDQDPFEVFKLLDVETSHILVDESNITTSSSQKKSLKARVKAIFNDENHKEQSPESIPSPRLQRTYAVHHSETNEWIHPIVFFPEDIKNDENPVSSKDPTNIANSKINDVLEIFKVNKDVFVNILQDDSRVSNTKAKLTKSCSFPVAYKSGSRNLRPNKLKHKLNEFNSISRNVKKLDTPAPKLASSNSVSGSLLDKKEDDLNDNDLIRMRRISSLNESAERFAHVLDFSIVKEASLQTSRSLKLINGSENPLGSQEPSFFRRIRSLPHLENLNQESRDTHFRRSSSQNERNQGLNSTENCKCLNGMIDKNDIISENERLICPLVRPPDVGKPDSNGFGEDMIGLTIDEDNNKKVSDISTHFSCSQEEFQISEGLESLNNSEQNLEKEIKNVKLIESSMKHYQDDDDFTYVKQILDQSGFIKNGFHQKWYSSNQPLDPFVFQEIESQYFHDPDHFAEEFKELSHRLLIFDLIDDILLNIYEQSLTCYPKALSSSCHIRLVPTGPCVLDEVWKRVSRLLKLNPDMNESLDSIVSKDLGTDDGWMNLQMDSECVGLDLEDLILDDVLEEVLFERS